MNSRPAAQEEESTQPPLIVAPGPRWAIIGIFLILLIAGFAAARSFLMPVVLSLLLAQIFTPIRRFLQHRGVKPAFSAFLIVSSLVSLLLIGVILLREPVNQWIEDAPTIGRRVENKVRRILEPAQKVMEASEQVDELATGGGEEEDDVQEVVMRGPGTVSRFVSEAPEILAQATLTMVLLMLLLASGDMFYEKIVHVLPTLKDKRKAVRILYDIENQLSRYLLSITIINAGLGVAIGTAMWFIGMPNPLLFAVIGFTFNYVPYIGAFGGTFLAALVGILTFDSALYALVPGVTYLTLTSLEGQFVTPYFVGRRLKMNTVVVFVAVAFWAWLWSVVGMVVAVPLLVTVRVFCEHVPTLRPLGDFLSGRGGEIERPVEEEAATQPA